MPIVRRVFGPFHREVQEKWDTRIRQLQPESVRWHFNGIRGDRTTAHWCLIYTLKTRKFSVASIPMVGMIGPRNRKVAHALRKDGIDETVNPDAFLDDGPVHSAPTLTEIFRPFLQQEDIAFATALSIQRIST